MVKRSEGLGRAFNAYPTRVILISLDILGSLIISYGHLFFHFFASPNVILTHAYLATKAGLWFSTAS